MSARTHLALVIGVGIACSAPGQGVSAVSKSGSCGGDRCPCVRYLSAPLVDGSDPFYRAALLGGPTNSIYAMPGLPVGTLSLLASPNTGANWVGFGSGWTPVIASATTPSGHSRCELGELPCFKWWYGMANYTTWEEAFNATKDLEVGTLVGTSSLMLCGCHRGQPILVKPSWLTSEAFSIMVIPEPSAQRSCWRPERCVGQARRRRARSKVGCIQDRLPQSAQGPSVSR